MEAIVGRADLLPKFHLETGAGGIGFFVKPKGIYRLLINHGPAMWMRDTVMLHSHDSVCARILTR
jgi:hypothetical protein